jgi:REP element-mobilizing transposase RayT
MPSAWTQNYYHTVFSTKDRALLIGPDLETRLYPFMGGILRERGCSLIAVNGMPDHVHLLIRYPSDLSHSDMLRHIKSRSSGWVHDTFPSLGRFASQNGYGGFTVSKSMVEAVAAYIARQKEHHRSQDFRSEFLELLRKHDIESDEAEVLE